MQTIFKWHSKCCHVSCVITVDILLTTDVTNGLRIQFNSINSMSFKTFFFREYSCHKLWKKSSGFELNEIKFFEIEISLCIKVFQS